MHILWAVIKNIFLGLYTISVCDFGEAGILCLRALCLDRDFYGSGKFNNRDKYSKMSPQGIFVHSAIHGGVTLLTPVVFYVQECNDTNDMNLGNPCIHNFICSLN